MFIFICCILKSNSCYNCELTTNEFSLFYILFWKRMIHHNIFPEYLGYKHFFLTFSACLDEKLEKYEYLSWWILKEIKKFISVCFYPPGLTPTLVIKTLTSLKYICNHTVKIPRSSCLRGEWAFGERRRYQHRTSCRGLFTYDVSQNKGGGKPPPPTLISKNQKSAYPPTLLNQQKSEIDIPPYSFC